MSENTWYPMPPKRRARLPVIKCECCQNVKPRDGQRPCLDCQAAGCKHENGLWKHGEKCPKRTRTKKSKSGIVIRKKLDRFG
jgi:hypothetical protein